MSDGCPCKCKSCEEKRKDSERPENLIAPELRQNCAKIESEPYKDNDE